MRATSVVIFAALVLLCQVPRTSMADPPATPAPRSAEAPKQDLAAPRAQNAAAASQAGGRLDPLSPDEARRAARFHAHAGPTPAPVAVAARRRDTTQTAAAPPPRRRASTSRKPTFIAKAAISRATRHAAAGVPRQRIAHVDHHHQARRQIAGSAPAPRGPQVGDVVPFGVPLFPLPQGPAGYDEATESPPRGWH